MGVDVYVVFFKGYVWFMVDFGGILFGILFFYVEELK